MKNNILITRKNTFCKLMQYIGYGVAILAGWLVFWSELMMAICR